MLPILNEEQKLNIKKMAELLNNSRLKKGMSIAELSRQTKIGRDTLSDILYAKCNPTIGTLMTICKTLNIQINMTERD